MLLSKRIATRMSTSLTNCANCGAQLAPNTASSVACEYCGSTTVVSIDPRALASTFTMDSSSLHAGFDRLLGVFQETLPTETTVHRSGLFVKNAHSFDVALDPFTFRLTRDGKKITAHRITTIRGISIKNETMAIEMWIAALAEKLSEMARDSANARKAFGLIGR